MTRIGLGLEGAACLLPSLCAFTMFIELSSIFVSKKLFTTVGVSSLSLSSKPTNTKLLARVALPFNSRSLWLLFTESVSCLI